MLARIAWVAMLAGCSYLQIDRPPRAVRATDALPACTAERTWPVVDAALAVGGVIGGMGSHRVRSSRHARLATAR